MEESPFLAAKQSLNMPRIRPYFKSSKDCLQKSPDPQKGSSDEVCVSCFEGVRFEFLRDDDSPDLGLPNSP
jgi:hypothetical protein